MSTIKIRRGTKAEISGITLALSELGYCTDTKELFVGDGVGNTLIGTTLLDEDDFASDSDAHAPTQQSVKQFVADNYVDVSGGSFTGNVNIGTATTSTESRILQLGNARTGDGSSYIDLVGDTTYTDYGFRILRDNTGENAKSTMYHRGTGDFSLYTDEAAAIKFYTNSIERGYFSSTGNLLTKNDIYVGDSGTSTEARSLQIGNARTGDGASFIDLVGDTTYTDYGLRFIRNGGLNSASQIVHRGTGALSLKTTDPADILFYTDDSWTMSITSAGQLSFPTGTGINEFSTDDTLAGDSDDAVPTEQAVKGYVDNRQYYDDADWTDSFNRHYEATFTTSSYLTTGEYIRVLDISPNGASENYIIKGYVTGQSGPYYCIIEFEFMLRSNTLPSTDRYLKCCKKYKGDKNVDFDLVIWTNSTTGDIALAIKHVAGSIQNLGFSADAVFRGDYASYVTINSTKDSETSTIPTNYAEEAGENYLYFLDDNNAAITGNLYIGDSSTSTEVRSLEIGTGRTGDGSSFIDLVGDTTYTDYGLRLIRSSGAGGDGSLIYNGGGDLNLTTIQSGCSINFSVSGHTDAVKLDSVGHFYLENGVGINEFSSDDTLAGDSDLAVPTEQAVKGYVDGLNFFENDITLTSNYTITTGKNAMSAGPITIDAGVTITVPSGSTWTVV